MDNIDNPNVSSIAGKKALWQKFCIVHGIAARSVPLFALSDDGSVQILRIGNQRIPVLRRSSAMEDMIGRSVAKILASSPETCEGLLYLMHRLDDQGEVIPLYVGRAGRHGKNGTLVSANLKGIERTQHGEWTNGRKFARWGYGYAYHLSDLSCAVLEGHSRRPTPKYQCWAQRLFEPVQTLPHQRFEVRFWCTPWDHLRPTYGRSLGHAHSHS